MKNVLFLVLLVHSSGLTAQNTLFLLPQAAIGGSNVREVSYGGAPQHNAVTSFDAAIQVGYQTDHLVISTGLEYLRTGFKTKLILSSPLSKPVKTDYYYWYFKHLVVPTRVGYKFWLAGKWALISTLGADIACNLSALETTAKYLGSKRVTAISSAQFDNTYNRLSVFAFAGVNAVYNLNPRLAVVCGPSFDYMLNDLWKTPSAANFKAQLNPYAYLFNAGIIWTLSPEVNTNKEIESKNE